MGKSEKASSQFPLRKSTRLLGNLRRSCRLIEKYAATDKHPTRQISIRTPPTRQKISIRKPSKRHVSESGLCTFVTKKLSAAQLMRSMRKSKACVFRNTYQYDGSIDKRVYVDGSGNSYSWTDRSTGCIWVAVQGKDSMFIAFKGTLDSSRYARVSKNMIHRFYCINVISEIEDITLSNCESRQPLDEFHMKPFGVVSVISSTSNCQESGNKASGGALEYLKERLGSGMEFTPTETKHTAIGALQRECNREFTAADGDIWVCSLELDEENLLLPCQLERLLANVNNTPLQPTV